MAIKDTYGGTPGAVASYDWQSLTTGLGYRTYYGASSTDSVGVKYFLTDRAVASSSGSTTSDTNVYTEFNAGADADIDFDITFGVPAIIGDGDCYVSIPMNDPDGASDVTWVINIYHYDGSTETSIGTATSNTINWGGGVQARKELIKVSLSRKKFAIGDILRLNVIMTNTDVSDVDIYHDPSSGVTLTDVMGRTIGTDLTFDVPFEVRI